MLNKLEKAINSCQDHKLKQSAKRCYLDILLFIKKNDLNVARLLSERISKKFSHCVDSSITGRFKQLSDKLSEIESVKSVEFRKLRASATWEPKSLVPSSGLISRFNQLINKTMHCIVDGGTVHGLKIESGQDPELLAVQLYVELDNFIANREEYLVSDASRKHDQWTFIAILQTLASFLDPSAYRSKALSQGRIALANELQKRLRLQLVNDKPGAHHPIAFAFVMYFVLDTSIDSNDSLTALNQQDEKILLGSMSRNGKGELHGLMEKYRDQCGKLLVAMVDQNRSKVKGRLIEVAELIERGTKIDWQAMPLTKELYERHKTSRPSKAGGGCVKPSGVVDPLEQEVEPDVFSDIELAHPHDDDATSLDSYTF